MLVCTFASGIQTIMNWDIIKATYQEQYEEDVLTLSGEGCTIVLHNDDYNTFDHVIESLIEVCKHEAEQAEQCAWITHFVGKCEVKKGSEELLKSMYRKLKVRGLTVTLEK